MLRSLRQSDHPDLLVGTDTGDDAAVWRRPDGRALVSTVDFFTPIVDDARTWGQIAAANSVSDVYAMGATPLFALNIVAWPRDLLPIDLLGEVLAGGQDVATAGGWVIAGGHSVDAPEPMYGQAVVGEVAEDDLLTNVGAQVGEALVLTKPLGTGLLATAVKRSEPSAIEPGGPLASTYRAGVAEMRRLNDIASRVARTARASAATDITGFGLLGHLHKLAAVSGVGAEIEVSAVPVLPSAWDLVDAGFVAGGTERNLEFVGPHLTGDVQRRVALLLSDAQTSGGLLFSCSPAAAVDAVDELVESGHGAAVIGRVIGAAPGSLAIS